MRVIIHPDGGALASATADLLTDLLREGGDLGLAGGSTPTPTYALLRHRPIAWNRVVLWLGDERWVPPDHPDNNARMVRESLSRHVPATFHAVPWAEDLTPTEAASAYDRTLHQNLRTDSEGILRPHVVLLGMGDDGHTASLFSGSAALDIGDRGYLADWVESKDTWRLSASMALLRASRHVIFLVSGSAKASMLARVLEGANSELPAARLASTALGEVTWMVDDAAAEDLGSVERT